jgi:hypothetical protein
MSSKENKEDLSIKYYTENNSPRTTKSNTEKINSSENLLLSQSSEVKIKKENSGNLPQLKVKNKRNSIELNKKQRKEKNLKLMDNNQKLTENNTMNNIIETEKNIPKLNLEKKENINNKTENKNKMKKKVTFSDKELVEVILVESYKEFNALNTCKDPYETLLNEEKKDKEKSLCSCVIF